MGIGIAKLLDMNNIWMLWFARLCNLLIYAGLCSLAIKKSPIKMPFLVVSCLPLCIVLAVSCSIDSLIISFSLVILAYLLTLYDFDEKSISNKQLAIFFILILILSLMKVSLCVLALLIFIIPRKKFANKKATYLKIIGIILIFVLTLIWVKFFAMNGIYHSWRLDYYLTNNINSTGQLNYIFSHPVATFKTFLNHSELLTQIYRITFIYAHYNIFNSLSIITVAFLLIFSIFYPINLKISKKARVVTFLTFIILVVGTYLIQYLTWAPVGSTNISDAGVQFRYFLPILPFLPLMFNLNKDFKIKNKELIIISVIIWLLTMCLTYVILTVY